MDPGKGRPTRRWNRPASLAAQRQDRYADLAIKECRSRFLESQHEGCRGHQIAGGGWVASGPYSWEPPPVQASDEARGRYDLRKAER